MITFEKPIIALFLINSNMMPKQSIGNADIESLNV